MPVIPDGYGQINWFLGGSALPRPAQVTMGFQLETATDPEAIAADANAAWVANMIPIQVNGVELQGSLVKLGPNDTGLSVFVADGTDASGSSGGVPPNVALLVRKVTGFGGRQGRGRMYVPGIPETAVLNDGSIASGSLPTFQGAVDNLLTDLNAAGINCVLLHGPGEPITVPFTINSLLVAPLVATQRRRLRP